MSNPHKSETCPLEDDSQLLEEFRRGTKSALIAVYMHYYREVYMSLKRGRPGLVNGVEEEALDDLLQAVFLSAFSEAGRKSYDGVRSYRAYLATIAKNKLVDHWRRRRRQARSLAGLALNATQQPCFRPGEQQIDWSRVAFHLATFVDTLPTHVRHFVELRFIQEMSQHQIPKQTLLTRRRVRTLELQLKRDLAAHLDDHCPAWRGLL